MARRKGGEDARAGRTCLDVYVPNEADGIVFTSRSLAGCGLLPGERGWSEAVERGDLIPLSVEREDGFVVRVVTGDLEEREEAEWVGRVKAPLRVPDGRLAISGGIDVLLAGFDHEDAEFVRFVDVAPGEYEATLLCYVTAPNGRVCLEAASGEVPRLGAWFRKTRPGAPFPPWLRNWCIDDPSEDPWHEAEWQDARPSPGATSLAVDFVLHLRPGSFQWPPDAPRLEDDFVALPVECRPLAACPLGVEARDVEGTPEVEAPPEAAPVVTRGGTAKASAPPEMAPVEGGPVEVPVRRLVRAFRLAWYSNPRSIPEVVISLPPESKFALQGEPLDDVFTKLDPGRIQVRVGPSRTGYLSDQPRLLNQLGARLASLPDGSIVELTCAPEKATGDPPAGLHRYRGPVAGGVWRIEEAFPPVSAEVLRAALALAEQVELGRVVKAQDEAEADRIVRRIERHAADRFLLKPLQRQGLELGTQKRDPDLLDEIALRAFVERFGRTWVVIDPDD